MTNTSERHDEVYAVISEASGTDSDGGEHHRIAEAVARHIEANYLPHEDTAHMVVAGRLDELLLMQGLVKELSDALTYGDGHDVLLPLMEHIGDRRRIVRALAARQGE